MMEKIFTFFVAVFVGALWLSACAVPIDTPPVIDPGKKYYVVTFDTNGGSPVPEEQSVLAGEKVAAPEPVEKADVTFDRWYEDAEFTIPWDFETGTVTADLILFAKWLPAYTVTFVANGGSSAPEPQVLPVGGRVTQPDPMTKTGFGFGGWYTDEDFLEAWDFANDTVDAAITLYAKWGANSYVVTFDANGGDGGSMQPLPRAYDSEQNIPANTYTRQFYTFLGWNTEAGGSGTPYAAGAAISNLTTDDSEEITLYAQWAINESLLQDYMEDYITNQSVGGVGDSPDNPTLITLSVELDETSWDTINAAIAASGKFVTLDLSGSSTTTGVFNGATNQTGMDKIAGIIMPDTVVEIAENSFYGGNFAAGAINLTTLSLPGVKTIGDMAFPYTINLTSLSLPEATSIGALAFTFCHNLINVNLPEVIDIGAEAFSYCASLTEISLPNAKIIGNGAFKECFSNQYSTGLQRVVLPQAESIGNNAFYNCMRLKTVIIPKATSIGNGAFYYCLATTPGPNTMQLGASPPILGTDVFYHGSNSKTITVYIPTGATDAYNTTAWTSSYTPSIGSAIPISYQTYAPASPPNL
jgi:uncharacterized repeat protein (TIGR02543 family)